MIEESAGEVDRAISEAEESIASNHFMISKSGKRTLVVKPTSIKVLGWICIVFFLFCAIMCWRAGPGPASPATHSFVVLLFLMFVALGIYLLLSSGSVEMDEQAIIYRSSLAQYQINWSEVRYIEIDSQGHNIVFCG